MKATVHALLAMWLAAVATLGQPASAPASAARSQTVRASAEGTSRDDALRRALRRAVEQAVGVELAAYSTVENFQLVRDTVYSRASAVVSEYRVVGESPRPGGTVEVQVEAVVRPDAIARTWGEVQHVLDQVGRPKILVWIDERIDGELQSESIVESRIEELLTRSGFDLVEKTALRDLRAREETDARDERNAAKLAMLAKDAGAHVIVRGAANANRAGLREVYGETVAFYNCDVLAKVYATDTARLLASESLPQTQAGARSHHEFSPQAARAALARATAREDAASDAPSPLARRVQEAILERWSLEITSAADVEVDVEGLDFARYVELKKALEALDGVRSIAADFTKGIGKFRIKCAFRADSLAEKLAAEPLRGWVEVVDLKPNRIQCKAVGPP